MIALDTNAVIHLLVKSQREHDRARNWFSRVKDPLATTEISLGEMLRLLTHPRVFPNPLSLAQAIDLVNDFIQQFEVEVLEESEAWWVELRGLLDDNPTLRGNEIFDARIALCLRYHGIKEICTLDSDFTKYSFLKVLMF